MRHRLARRWVIAGGAGAVAVVAFVFVWFQPQALFINSTVDEPLPTAAAHAPVSGAPAASPPPGGPVTLASGPFRSLEHETTGTALLIRLPDGSAIVRLEGFSTSNGPDVHVTLSPASSTAGDTEFAHYIDLGALKGNHGNQNYAVPAGTDVAAFRSVVIWCKRFSVGFAVAPIIQAA